MNRDSFVFYTRYETQFDMLTNEEIGILMRSVLKYQRTGEIPSLERGLMFIFSFIKHDLDRDYEKWLDTCNQRSDAGKKSAAKRAENKQNQQALTNSTNVDVVEQIQQNQQALTNSTNVDVVEQIQQNQQALTNSTEYEGEYEGEHEGESIKDSCATSRATEPESEPVEEKPKKPKLTVYSSEFEEFWQEYPRNEDKKSAYEVWQKIRPSPELIEKIMCGLKAAKQSSQWQDDGGKFIPYAVRWLRKERWNDKYDVKGGKADGQWDDAGPGSGFSSAEDFLFGDREPGDEDE